MSVPVVLDDLRGRVDEYGPVAFLVTTNADRSTHVVSAVVELDDDSIVVPVGRTSRANVRTVPAVTLLWPATPDGSFSLIVDAVATPTTDDGPLRLVPSGAILHRMAGRSDDGPTCLPVDAPPA